MTHHNLQKEGKKEEGRGWGKEKKKKEEKKKKTTQNPYST